MSSIDLTRVGRIIYLKAVQFERSALWSIPIVGTVLFVNLYLSGGGYDSSDASTYEIWYASALVLGLYWVAAGTLNELSTPDGRQAFLTLPASDTEKWLGVYIYSGPVILTVFTLAFWFLTVVVGLLLSLAGVTPPEAFNPFGAEVGEAILGYILIVQPLGFLSAIWFNKAGGIKVLGILTGVAIALALVAVITFRVVFHEYFTGLARFADVEFSGDDPLSINLASYGWWLAALTGSFLLTVAYFKFHEKEV